MSTQVQSFENHIHPQPAGIELSFHAASYRPRISEKRIGAERFHFHYKRGEPLQ
jgi:hypothetical protein